MEKLTMEKLVNLCKQHGFIYQGSEIYGGLANTWDFGPVGAELKGNIKKAWLKKFIQEDPNNVGLDSAILLTPKPIIATLLFFKNSFNSINFSLTNSTFITFYFKSYIF